jgi:predicted transposase YdaD
MSASENDPQIDHASPPERDEAIQSPHDRLVNLTLQQIDAARSLIAKHLPDEVVQHLKLDTLTPVDTSLIDHNLRRRFADRLFSVEVTDEMVGRFSMRTKYVYVLILIDHKSTDDSRVLIQMLGYMVRIWENALANNQPLVPILPWVLYNGVGPWRAARSLADLIPVPDSWKRYIPALELLILDISRMDDGAMAGEPILHAALKLLKYGRRADLEVILRSLFEVLAQSLSAQQARNLLDTIRIYVMSVNPVMGEEKVSELVTEFWPVQPEPGSVADQLIKKGEARGEARGRASEKANMIRILQSILSVPQSTDQELSDKKPEELQATIEQLQQQIINRPS